MFVSRPSEIQERRGIQAARICAVIFLLVSTLMIARVQETRRDESLDEIIRRRKSEQPLPWMNSSTSCSMQPSVVHHFSTKYRTNIIDTLISVPAPEGSSLLTFSSLVGSNAQLHYYAKIAGQVKSILADGAMKLDARDFSKGSSEISKKRAAEKASSLISVLPTSSIHSALGLTSCAPESDPFLDLNSTSQDLNVCFVGFQSLNKEDCLVSIMQSPKLGLSRSCSKYLAGRSDSPEACHRVILANSNRQLVSMSQNMSLVTGHDAYDDFVAPFCGSFIKSSFAVDDVKKKVLLLFSSPDMYATPPSSNKGSPRAQSASVYCVLQLPSAQSLGTKLPCTVVPPVDVAAVRKTIMPILPFGPSDGRIVPWSYGASTRRRPLPHVGSLWSTPFMMVADRSSEFLVILESAGRVNETLVLKVFDGLAEQNLKHLYSIQFDNMNSGWIIDAPNNTFPGYLLLVGDTPPHQYVIQSLELRTGTLTRTRMFTHHKNPRSLIDRSAVKYPRSSDSSKG